MEVVLHKVRDEAQQRALGDLAAQHPGHGAQDLSKGRAHGGRGVQAQRRQQRQDVRLQLLGGERHRQSQAGLYDAHSLLPDLLLVVPQELHEGLHEARGHEVGTEGRAQLVEALGHGEPHAPGAVLGGVPDDGDGVQPVLFGVEHPGDHQGRVDAGHADDVLRVLLRELLVHRDCVREEIGFVANRDQVLHLVGSSSPDHGRVVHAESCIGLAEAGFLVLRRVPVCRGQQRARGDPCREEVRPRGKPVQGGDEVLRHERGPLVHDRAQRLDGLVADDRLVLRSQVLQRGDQQLILAVDVLREHGVLLCHAREELLVVAEGLLLHGLDDVGQQLAHRPLRPQSRGDEAELVDGAYPDGCALVPDLLLEEL
mmetsp:Transcript_47637/g.136017  ORF Transcript_47637/g.136017 Transcript_47637/m.136017 type:complete len:369 (+) Transcript_47637:709-1815(+)